MGELTKAHVELREAMAVDLYLQHIQRVQKGLFHDLNKSFTVNSRGQFIIEHSVLEKMLRDVCQRLHPQYEQDTKALGLITAQGDPQHPGKKRAVLPSFREICQTMWDTDSALFDSKQMTCVSSVDLNNSTLYTFQLNLKEWQKDIPPLLSKQVRDDSDNGLLACLNKGLDRDTSFLESAHKYVSVAARAAPSPPNKDNNAATPAPQGTGSDSNIKEKHCRH